MKVLMKVLMKVQMKLLLRAGVCVRKRLHSNELCPTRMRSFPIFLLEFNKLKLTFFHVYN